MKMKTICILIIAMIVTTIAVSMISTKVEATTNDTFISNEIQSIVEDVSAKYNVCPELILAIIEQESSGNPNAVNGDCKGLMQVSEKWHKDRMERIGVTDLFDQYGNILVGTDYFMELADEYDDLYLVLMIYSGTSDAFERAETYNWTEYAETIVKRTMELEEIHGKLN